MAIKINSGTYPQPGRLTLPQGTFLGNPATAADGMNQGGAGMLPPTPQINMWQGVTPGYNQQLNPNSPRQNTNNPLANPYNLERNPFAPYQFRPTPIGQQFPTRPGPRPGGFGTGAPEAQPVSFGNAIRTALGVQTIPEVANNPAVSPTSVFKSPTTNSPGSSLVGSQILSFPTQISTHQINQIMPGLTSKELQDAMATRGFVRTYRAGVGEVWILGEGGTNAPIASGNGRPEFVDGASLERGDRVTDASGFSYVGGAEYTDKEGNTVGQYAVTVPGGPGPGEDKHGKYKWVSTVTQDKDGNWVRKYRQQLRKVYTRSHQKKQAARREAAGNQQQVNSAEYNQLVNFRADFG